MTVRQPSAVYPPPRRAWNGWQLLQSAATISLPLPSGNSGLQAGSANHIRAATSTGRSDLLDMLPSPYGLTSTPSRLSTIDSSPAASPDSGAEHPRTSGFKAEPGPGSTGMARDSSRETSVAPKEG